MPTITYTPLANFTLTSTTSTVTISSISQSYRDLVLVATLGSTNGAADILVSINGNTTDASYAKIRISGNGSAGSSGDSTPRAIDWAAYSDASMGLNIIKIDFLDYSATDKHKTYLTRNNHPALGVDLVTTRWASTAAITSFTITGGTWGVGNSFALYGIAA